MAFIQYFSEANSESLVDSYLTLLKDYGMIIPETFTNSKQLFAEFKDNNSYSKVNILISWVNESQKHCSIEIWSDEPFLKQKTLCNKVHKDISEFIIPRELNSKNQ